MVQKTRAVKKCKKTKKCSANGMSWGEWPIWSLVVALVILMAGGVVFVGAVAGWFEGKVVIDAEYYNETPVIRELEVEEYNQLVAEQKSFVIFVSQPGCTTAERLRGFVEDYMATTGLSVYEMTFADLRETALNETVKFYPSVIIMRDGKVAQYLRADADADAGAYNDYADFVEWMEKRIKFNEA